MPLLEELDLLNRGAQILTRVHDQEDRFILNFQPEVEVVDMRGRGDHAESRSAQDSLEPLEHQKVRPQESRREGSPKRAIIAGGRAGKLDALLRVILGQISCPPVSQTDRVRASRNLSQNSCRIIFRVEQFVEA